MTQKAPPLHGQAAASQRRVKAGQAPLLPEEGSRLSPGQECWNTQTPPDRGDADACSEVSPAASLAPAPACQVLPPKLG